jgi:predicted amidohydrolase YtcJ
MSYLINRRGLLTFVCLCLGIFISNPSRAGGGADLILTNGHVYTADAKSRWADAVAVKGGKIIYVGTSAGAKARRGSNTKEIDLGGRLLLPGFFDVHNHADGRAEQLYLAQLGSQFSTHTLESYRQTILEFRASHPDIKQLRGVGFDGWILPAIAQSRKRQPRQLLDDIVSDIPAFILSWTGHQVWVNSKAIELAGVTKDTPDPPMIGATIDHDPVTGEPNGMFYEDAADRLILPKLPEPQMSVAQYREGMLSFQRDIALPSGITGVLIPTAAPAENFDTALQQLSDEGKLTLHYSAAQWVDSQFGVKQVPELVAGRARFHAGPYIKFNVIKIWAPWPQDELNETVAALDKQGFQVYVHQTGPTENYTSVLDAFEYALKQNGPRDSRHIITHNRAESAPLAARSKALNVRADADWHMRTDWYLAPQAFIGAGVPFTLSTDYPVRNISHLQAALAECAKHGIPREALIDSITIRGAETLFIEKQTGSITAGKAADMIVMDKDLFEIAPEEIERAKVLLTLFAGKELFRDPSF